MKKYQSFLFKLLLLSTFVDFCFAGVSFRGLSNEHDHHHSPEHFSNSSTSSHMKVQCAQCSNPNTYTCGFLNWYCCDCPAGQYSWCGNSNCAGTPSGKIK